VSAELDPAEVEAIRRILRDAFGDDLEASFTELDWDHALGGIHVVGDIDGRIVAHASVVARELRVAGRPIATGYVEAVAVRPGEQGRGVGTAVMRDVGAIIDRGYEMGALGTGEHGFYERLGWRTWRGPSSVRTASGDTPTPQDDGNILVLATTASPSLDLDAPISCDWRPGDAW
jgi:aminoglycoside 2'-N-acetyltransferase I